MPEKIGDKFREKVRGLKEYVALATVEASKYQKTNLEIIKEIISDENIPGVYVTLNKPFRIMQSIIKKEKINSDMIIFIDAVTKTVGGEIKKTENCLFIGSPENLSDISIAMDQAVRAVPSEEKFVFFDSLNTLLLYNKAVTVARFIHFLAGKMRVWKVRGIIVSLQKEKNKELIDELMQFCDVSIDFGEEK